MIKTEIQDLRIKTRQTKKLKRIAAQVREGMRQNIIAKGYVHFRVSPEFYKLLFEIADTKQVPLGILCRQWVAERAEQELTQANQKTEKRSPALRSNHNSVAGLDVVALSKRLDKLEIQLQRMR